MKVRDFEFLADECFDPEVVTILRERGWRIRTAAESGLLGADDVTVLERATAEGRVVLTHDSDFGTLAVLGRKSLVGIIHLRPGQIDPQLTLASINAIEAHGLELRAPFVIVARRGEAEIIVRIRQL